MGSGEYSAPIYVRHEDGKIYEYFMHANPVGNDSVDLCRKLLKDGDREICYPNNSTERVVGFQCRGGKIVEEGEV